MVMNKRYLSILFVLTAMINLNLVIADEKEEYGSVSGKFLGYCQGSQYLKQKYCPTINQMSPKECLNVAVNELPPRYRDEFRTAIETLLNDPYIIKQTREAIESNYLIALKKYNGDSGVACKAWHGLILQEQMDSFQRMKNISRDMK